MFYRILFVCMSAFSASVYAATGSIQDRINAAHKLENSTHEASYQARIKAAIGPHLNGIIRDCASQQSSGRPAPFVLVADITAYGSLTDVDLDKSSPFSECFANAVSGLQLPVFPASYQDTTYPIVIEMNFH